MPNITIKGIDELDSYENGGRFRFAGKSLGVTAWGMNVLNFPPNWKDYPNHDHLEDEQEEVYLVLEGSAVIEAQGKEFPIDKHKFAHVPKDVKRKIVPGKDGVTILAIGGTPGQGYKPKK